MKKIIIIIYAIVLIFFSIFSYFFIDSNIPLLKLPYAGLAFSNRPLTAFSYILFIVIAFAFYGIFIYLGIKKKLNFKDIFILISITVVALFFSYPAMLSYDIFNYTATSKVLFFYHENPYVVMPIELTGDPLLVFMHAANKIALYGPFWILLTGIPYFMGINNLILTLFGFKIMSAFFYLATTFLVWRISKNALSVILFSLNPLIIIETLVSGHNDIVMMFFALLSLLFLMKKKIFFAVLLFALSMLIKYTTVLLIPVFFFAVWKIIINKEINWKSIFNYSSLLMYLAFFISPVRVEIYPWYAIWFLSFVFLIPEKKLISYISIAFSFGLLLRYVPFILLATHADPATKIKALVTFVPIIVVLFYLFMKEKIWEKVFSR